MKLLLFAAVGASAALVPRWEMCAYYMPSTSYSIRPAHY